MNYESLKTAMYRLGIDCGKDEMLGEEALVAIVQQQAAEHHKRPAEVTAAARDLARKLGVSAGTDSSGEPAPSATPAKQEKRAAGKSTHPEDSPSSLPSTIVNPQQAVAASPNIAAPPAWRLVAHEVWKAVSVATLISFQAFIFAALAMRVLNEGKTDVHLQFWFAFVAACLIESGGVMIVSRYKVPEGAGEWTKRDIESNVNKWLVPFMVFQILVDLAYINLLGPWSDIAGKWLIALAIPMGIFVYSHLYFNRN